MSGLSSSDLLGSEHHRQSQHFAFLSGLTSHPSTWHILVPMMSNNGPQSWATHPTFQACSLKHPHFPCLVTTFLHPTVLPSYKRQRVLVSGANFWEHRLWLSPDRLPRPWRDVGQTLSSFAPVSRIESLSRGLVRSYHKFRSNWELITIKKYSNCFFWRPGCELAWWWLLGRKWAVREQWAPERAVDKMNQLWARVK